MSSPLSIRLPELLDAELAETSLRLKRSKSYIIKSALEQYFNEFADYQIALDRLNDKNDPVMSASSFRSDNGL